MKNSFKVDFSIDNLSLNEQQKVFETVVNCLDYSQRQNLHITITDPIGGKHFIWDNKGVDPDNTPCKKCSFINCADCMVYEGRKNKKG